MDVDFLWKYYCLLGLLFLVTTMIVVVEFRAFNVAFLFWGSFFVAYLVPALFDPFNAEAQVNAYAPVMDLRQNPVLMRAHFFALGFSICYLVVRLLTYRKEIAAYEATATPDVYRQRLSRDRTAHSLLLILKMILLASAALTVMAIVQEDGLRGLLAATYSSYREDANSAMKLVGYYLCFAASGGLFIAWCGRRWADLVVSLAAVSVTFLVGRTRQLLLPAILPFVVYLLYRERNSARRVLRILVYAGALYYLFLFLQVLRYQGDLKTGLENLFSSDLYAEFGDISSEGKGEAVRRLQYYYFMQYGDQMKDFGSALTYRRLLLLPFPSGMIGDLKPRLLDEILYEEFYDEGHVERGTTHALFFGNVYIDLGWWGMLAGAGWALAFGGLNRLLARCAVAMRAIMMPVLCYTMCMSARGAVYNSFAVLFWVFVFCGCLYVPLHFLTRSWGIAAIPSPVRRDPTVRPPAGATRQISAGQVRASTMRRGLGSAPRPAAGRTKPP